MLTARIRKVAEAGRMRVAEGAAVQLVQAGATGTALTLLAAPADRRDLGLSHLAREAVIAAITTDAPRNADGGPVSAAVQLRATLHRVTSLTRRERGLLKEWLDRIADPPRA